MSNSTHHANRWDVLFNASFYEELEQFKAPIDVR